MNNKTTYFQNPIFKHTLFWIGVSLYFILTANMDFYSGYIHAVESNLLIVIAQIITAYVCIYILIPTYLNQQKPLLFTFGLVTLLFGVFVLYVVARIIYLDPKYYDFYGETTKTYVQMSFWQRVLDFDVFLSKAIKYLTPTGLLLLTSFYQDQQKFLQLKEQKRTAELSALKNQLNPHFLFNTLNNLYALAVKKSDKTPEAIGKLSDILDYMLYRCDEKLVPLDKEMELIENYLSLEKIRYGKRVNVNFETSLHHDLKIAPLLLLTFIENAFKHGVSQELGRATIDISLETKNDEIDFCIKNSVPQTTVEAAEKEAIGLKNVKKQLDLIYPNSHELKIDTSKNSYQVKLKLKTI